MMCGINEKRGCEMEHYWPTKEQDMHLAQLIMEAYSDEQQSDSLGLFELVVDQEEKKMGFRLSSWVLALAQQFNLLYGADQGDYVTRLVVSRCMVQGQTLH
jgi:hypothetical protein